MGHPGDHINYIHDCVLSQECFIWICNIKFMWPIWRGYEVYAKNKHQVRFSKSKLVLHNLFGMNTHSLVILQHIFINSMLLSSGSLEYRGEQGYKNLKILLLAYCLKQSYLSQNCITLQMCENCILILYTYGRGRQLSWLRSLWRR